MGDRPIQDSMQLGSAQARTVIRVAGRATLQQSPALRAAAEIALERGPLVIDVRECEYLDSTMLGCLVGIRKLAEQQNCRLHLAADRGQQVKLFSTSALNRYFDFIPAADAVEGEWLEIEPENLDAEALGRHVLACHERLADRGGSEGDAFRQVCDRLSLEIEQREVDRALRAANGKGTA